MRLIDVSVLKEWVENWFTKNRFYHPYAKNNNIPITELYDILEQLPSAQSERERGEWYKPKEYPRDSYRYICSNCQDVAYYVTGNNGKKHKEDKPKCGYRYCPNCGARMTERRTDEQT